MSPFLKPLKMLFWESFIDKVYQYLEQFTETVHFCRVFVYRRLSARHFTKDVAHC